jgi:hypothetical protein
MIAQRQDIPIFQLHTSLHARLRTWCCLTHFLSHENAACRFISTRRSGRCMVAANMRLMPQARAAFHVGIRRKLRDVIALHPYVSALWSEPYACEVCDEHPKHISYGSIFGWTEGMRG